MHGIIQSTPIRLPHPGDGFRPPRSGRHDQRIVATRAAAAGICAGHAASGQVQPERLENLESTNWGVHHFW